MNFEEDAVAVPTNKQLKELSKLVKFQIRLEDGIDDMETKLKEAKKKLAAIQRGAIPDLMKDIGLLLLKDTNGFVVEIKEGITASILKKDEPKAFAWLRKGGNESIIKTEIKLVYTGAEEKKIQKAFRTLDKASVPYALKEGIHTQTLKAFVKAELEVGHKIPASISVFNYGEAKIKRK